MLKEVIIILGVLIYWKFIYYKYHSSKNAALVLLIPSIIALGIGLYSYFFEKNIFFSDIKIIYWILIILYTISLFLVFLAIRKHGIKPDIDRLSEWTYRIFGEEILFLGAISNYVLYFFILIGTYTILGREHIYLWIMIIGAWIVSQGKLFLRYVIK